MNLRWIPVLSMILGSTTPALAHPHVFIANRTTLSFSKGMLAGFGFQWTFDPMFSAMILGDYDPGDTAGSTRNAPPRSKQGHSTTWSTTTTSSRSGWTASL